MYVLANVCMYVWCHTTKPGICQKKAHDDPIGLTWKYQVRVQEHKRVHLGQVTLSFVSVALLELVSSPALVADSGYIPPSPTPRNRRHTIMIAYTVAKMYVCLE